MIYYLPIERLQERYTAQMFTWCIEGFHRKGVFKKVVEGESLSMDIRKGEFLDIVSTTYYKNSQLMQIVKDFNEGKVEDGDIFFMGDLWYPGLEAIPYMAELLGIKVKIYGVHYAGVFDQHDFVHKLIPWGKDIEKGWLSFCDGVFYGSQFHMDMVEKYTGLNNGHVTGLVWDCESVRARVPGLEKVKKENIVLFPHRICTEKNYDLFTRLAKRNPYIRFVVSSSRQDVKTIKEGNLETVGQLTKDEYYKLIAKSKVVFSGAYQETFGYAINEAIALGTNVLCPNRLSYPEVLENDKRFLYDGDLEIEDKLNELMQADYTVPYFYTKKYDRSMDTMIDIMRGGK